MVWGQCRPVHRPHQQMENDAGLGSLSLGLWACLRGVSLTYPFACSLDIFVMKYTIWLSDTLSMSRSCRSNGSW